MSDPNLLCSLEDLFRALASQSRLQILRLLNKHPLCVGALAARLQMTPGAISQHLQVLREAGLVVGDRRGCYMHYRLREGVQDRIAEAIRDMFGGADGPAASSDTRQS